MRRGKPTGPIIYVAALGALMIAMLGFVVSSDAALKGFSTATAFTARWSVLWFAAAWSASSLAKLWPGGWRGWLLYNRRGVGLGFAFAHFIHAYFFLGAILVFGHQTTLTTVLGGGIGYVFVAAMALTSNDWAVRKLGANWKRLHTLGGYVIAFIFAFTYYGRIAHQQPLIGAYGLLVLGGAAALKVAAFAKSSARQPKLA
ncbi:MAG: hypothetical protein ABUS48_03205 [Pseudomonadota bacterium]